MQKLVTVLSVLIITSFLAGCGGSSSPTAATTTTYYKPLVLGNYSTSNLMGGAVNGGAIAAKFSNYSVSTFAGTVGTAGFTNNSTTTLPTTAKFNHPVAITTDGTNLYVADYNNNNAIRQIDPAKKVTTLTLKDLDGNAVTLYHPSGITTDGINLYVADSGNNVIRIITYSGVVTTIGSATSVAGSVDTTVPADARFTTPLGITTDGNNLYVTDTGNHTIRMINISSKAVTTLAGAPGVPGSANGSQTAARFNMPADITTNMKNLYVTDFNNRTIRSINLSSGDVDTLAGIVGTFGTADTAPGITATFYHPNGITTDGKNLYVTDYNDTSLPNPQYWNAIRKIEISTKAVTTIAGGISSISPFSFDAIGTNARFANPIGITTDGTSLFVVDSLNNTIRKIE